VLAVAAAATAAIAAAAGAVHHGGSAMDLPWAEERSGVGGGEEEDGRHTQWNSLASCNCSVVSLTLVALSPLANGEAGGHTLSCLA
jgi:hypothetical protein